MKIKKAISIIIVILLTLMICLFGFNRDKAELRSIKSKKELEKIYYGKNSYSYEDNVILEILSMPFTYYKYAPRRLYNYTNKIIETSPDIAYSSTDSFAGESILERYTSDASSAEIKDFSTTNIQVENVDEADITKTDGNYIYSISESNIIITDVRNPENIKVAAKINLYGYAPDDIILYKNKLVVIFADASSGWARNQNTLVGVYDITDKEHPQSLKTFTLYSPYYTCRCINNNLYVIASGNLRKDGETILTSYIEDSKTKEIPLHNIQYLTTVDSTTQTIISKVDLDNVEDNISINSYLIDVSNAYVSENAIYLLNHTYNGYYRYYDKPPISSLFTYKGALGPFLYNNNSNTDYGYSTEFYKFDILKDGSISYASKATVHGETINQYSLDEYNGFLRVALYDDNGSKISVFDNNMNLVGESSYVARGEKMYSSRFMGNKAYFVTFKTMDPLYVMDLSDPKEPHVLGELKIPGYSTYLHPYDENHLIGIGMETEEKVYRNSYGKVTSTTSRVTGMKMALFDVTDVKHPIELSKTVIGDSQTTSAILTNPKALLFSKEKELIAIPVNNYEVPFTVNYSENTDSMISSYKNYNKNYLSEGYLVYKINLEDGFNFKGLITHEKNTSSYNYYTTTKLLRGLYIDNNLYTVSETAIKVNSLEDLEEISEILFINNNKSNNSNKKFIEEVN